MDTVWSQECNFRRFWWYGLYFEFTTGQAAIVKLLVEAFEVNSPDCFWGDLKDAAGIGSQSMAQLFHRNGKKHPAWKSVIVTLTPGWYRLAKPPFNMQDTIEIPSQALPY